MTDDTESTEALIGDTEAADTEKEESEDILKKDGNVTPGSTYAAATSIGLNTTYNATTSSTSRRHWYKFTMSKAGMVQLKFAHVNLSGTNNSADLGNRFYCRSVWQRNGFCGQQFFRYTESDS